MSNWRLASATLDPASQKGQGEEDLVAEHPQEVPSLVVSTRCAGISSLIRHLPPLIISIPGALLASLMQTPFKVFTPFYHKPVSDFSFLPQTSLHSLQRGCEYPKITL